MLGKLKLPGLGGSTAVKSKSKGTDGRVLLGAEFVVQPDLIWEILFGLDMERTDRPTVSL